MPRRKQEIFLIIVGSLVAVMIAIIAALATNDDFQRWAKAQRWYSVQRVWLSLAALVIVGIVIAIRQYLVSNSKTPESLSLVAGIIDPSRYINPPERTASAKETALLYLLEAPVNTVSIVHCLFRLANILHVRNAFRYYR
jgi:hypothetical protein